MSTPEDKKEEIWVPLPFWFVTETPSPWMEAMMSMYRPRLSITFELALSTTPSITPSTNLLTDHREDDSSRNERSDG